MTTFVTGRSQAAQRPGIHNPRPQRIIREHGPRNRTKTTALRINTRYHLYFGNTQTMRGELTGRLKEGMTA
jgi:hypothetical protein